MSQLDNFRKSLGLPDPEEENVLTPVDDEKKNVVPGKRSVSLREETYQKCRAILFWLGQRNPEKRATIDGLVGAAMDLYLEKYPDAKAFYESNKPGRGR